MADGVYSKSYFFCSKEVRSAATQGVWGERPPGHNEVKGSLLLRFRIKSGMTIRETSAQKQRAGNLAARRLLDVY